MSKQNRINISGWRICNFCNKIIRGRKARAAKCPECGAENRIIPLKKKERVYKESKSPAIFGSEKKKRDDWWDLTKINQGYDKNYRPAF